MSPKQHGPDPRQGRGRTGNDSPTDPTTSPASGAAQRARLLGRLRQGPITTVQARAELDVLHPGARVLELRKRGHEIVTTWAVVTTAEGQPHRVGVYTLLREAA